MSALACDTPGGSNNPSPQKDQVDIDHFDPIAKHDQSNASAEDDWAKFTDERMSEKIDVNVSSSDSSSDSESDTDEEDSDEGSRAARGLAGRSPPGDFCATNPNPMITKGLKYDVTFPAGSKVDLLWETDWEGKIKLVKEFVRDSDGKHGVARESGIVELQHFLIAVNGDNVTMEDFHETMKRFKDIKDQETVLRFCDPSGGDGGSMAPEMKAVLREIHDHKVKFYKPTDTSVREEANDCMTKCYVKIYEGDWLTSFHLHLEQDNSFIIAASCTEDMSSGFIFHTLSEMTWEATISDIPINPHSHSYLGQMIPNFSGTNFTIHDYRVVDPAKDPEIHELGHIVYDVNIMGRVPNSLKAFMPRYDDHYMDKSQKNTIAERIAVQGKKHDDLEKTLVDKILMKEDHKYKGVESQEEVSLLPLQTKKPEWSEAHEAWCLDFGGRVKKASKKNFIMVVEEGLDA